MLDRKTKPQSLPVSNIDFLDIEKKKLSNDIPIYLINAGQQDVIKFELISEAGHWRSTHPLLADFTNRMLTEGSSKYTQNEIAEKFDFYGTFINYECGKHFATQQLYCLNNFFEQSLEVFQSFIKHPVFPEKEFKIHLKNEYQQYVLGKEKTEVLAANAFYESLFGKEHPYGKSRNEEDFSSITINDVKDFHKTYYTPEYSKIIISGKLDKNILDSLETYFGTNNWPKGIKTEENQYSIPPYHPGKRVILKESAVQSSIRIGKPTIEKKHEDFHALSILNTILGGYYGSRLMVNLREKKGLTYNISSSLSSLLYCGIFSISTNVNTINTEKAIDEIYAEIDKLKTKLVPEEELNMVKNYLSGEMLRAFDGPLRVSEIYAGLLNYGLDLDYYKLYFKTLKSITPKKLRELANIHFQKESFSEIIAGKPE